MLISERIKNKSSEQRVIIKGQEIAKIGSVARTNVKYSKADYDIEIVEINPIQGGIEVFARAWDKKGQVGFGDGTIDIERFRIQIGGGGANGHLTHLVVPDPNGTIEVEYSKEDGTTYTKKYREDAKQVLLNDLAHTISVIPKFGSERIVPNKRGSTTSTFNPVAGANAPCDGRTIRHAVNQTFTNIQNGAGTLASATVAEDIPSCTLGGSATTDQFQRLDRVAFGFPTGTLPDTDTISAANLSFYRGASGILTDLGDTDINVVSVTLASEADVGTADYAIANWGTTLWATGVAISTWAAGYNDIALNATGIAAISQTGNSFFGLRSKWDVDNSFTGTWSSGAFTIAYVNHVDSADSGTHPKLVVTHAAAGGAANHWLLTGV